MMKPSINKLGYNTIPEQRLTYANQLNVRDWNLIINSLRAQTNGIVDYLRQLHEWLTILDDDWLEQINANFEAIDVSLTDIITNYATKEYVENNSTSQTTAIVIDALTNLNGRQLTAYEQTQVTINNYCAIKITKSGSNLTKELAKQYMEFMTGSKYVPEYNFEKPKNSFMVFADMSIWKPQWDSTNGMLLYNISNKQPTIYYNDTLPSNTSRLKNGDLWFDETN